MADDLAIWAPDSHDIIFCRNVLMYLTPAHAEAIVARMARALRAGGYLFLGHAETLRGLSSDFHVQHTHGAFYYQRHDRLADQTPRHGTDRQLPVPAAGDDPPATTWVDVIRRASERIEALSSAPGARPRAASCGPARPAHRCDPTVVLELLREERFTEALEVLEGLPADSDRDPKVLLLRAVLLTHGGRFADAEHTCRQLLAIDELNAGAHYLRALCREGVA